MIDYISVCILIKFKKVVVCFTEKLLNLLKNAEKKKSCTFSAGYSVCTCLFCSVIITGNFTDSFSLHHINNGDFLFQPAIY